MYFLQSNGIYRRYRVLHLVLPQSSFHTNRNPSTFAVTHLIRNKSRAVKSCLQYEQRKAWPAHRHSTNVKLPNHRFEVKLIGTVKMGAMMGGC